MCAFLDRFGSFTNFTGKYLTDLDLDRMLGWGGGIFQSDEHRRLERKIFLAPDFISPNMFGLRNRMNENVRKGRNRIRPVTAPAAPY